MLNGQNKISQKSLIPHMKKVSFKYTHLPDFMISSWLTMRSFREPAQTPVYIAIFFAHYDFS